MGPGINSARTSDARENTWEKNRGLGVADERLGTPKTTRAGVDDHRDCGFNPLSAITIGGLEDLGFEVNYAGKDAYTVPSNSALIMPGTGPRLPAGWERVLTPIGVIENGRVRPKP